MLHVQPLAACGWSMSARETRPWIGSFSGWEPRAHWAFGTGLRRGWGATCAGPLDITCPPTIADSRSLAGRVGATTCADDATVTDSRTPTLARSTRGR